MVEKNKKKLTILSQEAEKAYEEGQDVNKVAQKFFELLNLDYPGLKDIKKQVEKEDYLTALNIYRDKFVENLSNYNFGSLEMWNAGQSIPDDCIKGYAKIGRHSTGQSRNYIGEPGKIDWFKQNVDEIIDENSKIGKETHESSNRDFATHLSTMHFTNNMIKAYVGTYEGVLEYENSKYLKRWVAIWEDFVLRHKLGFQKVVETKQIDKYNALAASQYQGLFVGWRENNFFDGINVACRNYPEKTRKNLSPVKLANILIAMIQEHVKPMIAGKAYPGAPNQQWEANTGILKLIIAIPELPDKEQCLNFIGEKIKEYIESGSMLYDGSDKEQSFNYNSALLNGASRVVNLLEQCETVPGWYNIIKPAIVKRYRFLNTLQRPTKVRHKNLLPGADQYGDGETVTKHKRPKMLIEDPLVKEIYDHMYSEGEKPGFDSLAYPFGGYYVMRSGWKGDAFNLFFKNSRPGTGHCSQDRNNIQLTAYGRTMLIDSGPTNYTAEFCSSYLYSAFAHNTMVVDDKTQNRGQSNDLDFNLPVKALWYTSNNFDFAEGNHIHGYEEITDVSHKRQVIFLRKFKVWIVIDIMLSETEKEHKYSQVWNFSPEYNNEQVIVNKKEQKIITNRAEEPNICLYNISVNTLNYEKFYGQKQPEIRGWYKSHWQANPEPKVDVHGTLRGKGNKLIVTLIEPRDKDDNNFIEIKKINKKGIAGFIAEKDDGTEIIFKSAINPEKIKIDNYIAEAKSVLLTKTARGKRQGLVIGGKLLAIEERELFTSENFEFNIEDNRIKFINSLKIPKNFKWVETKNGIMPEYI